MDVLIVATKQCAHNLRLTSELKGIGITHRVVCKRTGSGAETGNPAFADCGWGRYLP